MYNLKELDNKVILDALPEISKDIHDLIHALDLSEEERHIFFFTQRELTEEEETRKKSWENLKDKNFKEWDNIVKTVLPYTNYEVWSEDHYYIDIYDGDPLSNLEQGYFFQCNTEEEALFLFNIFDGFGWVVNGFDFENPKKGTYVMSDDEHWIRI